jgi:hypothetical protein
MSEFRPAPLTIDLDGPDWLPFEALPTVRPTHLSTQTIALMLKQGLPLPEWTVEVFQPAQSA